MRRTTSLTAAGLLGLALAAVPATGATAAGETCRGEAATIVGTGPTVTGTEGRDVIVTAAARAVVALGGDDLICLSGTPSTGSDFINVDAGAGADTVDSTALLPGSYATTVLGAGADTFVGGRPTTGWSRASRWPSPVAAAPLGRHGEGRPSTPATRATASPPVSRHDEQRCRHPRHRGGRPHPRRLQRRPDAVLDGGTGSDGLNLLGGTGDLAVDLAAGTLTTSLGTARFSGYESASLEVGTATSPSVAPTDPTG